MVARDVDRGIRRALGDESIDPTLDFAGETTILIQQLATRLAQNVVHRAIEKRNFLVIHNNRTLFNRKITLFFRYIKIIATFCHNKRLHVKNAERAPQRNRLPKSFDRAAHYTEVIINQ